MPSRWVPVLFLCILNYKSNTHDKLINIVCWIRRWNPLDGVCSNSRGIGCSLALESEKEEVMIEEAIELYNKRFLKLMNRCLEYDIKGKPELRKAITHASACCQAIMLAVLKWKIHGKEPNESIEGVKQTVQDSLDEFERLLNLEIEEFQVKNN